MKLGFATACTAFALLTSCAVAEARSSHHRSHKPAAETPAAESDTAASPDDVKMEASAAPETAAASSGEAPPAAEAPSILGFFSKIIPDAIAAKTEPEAEVSVPQGGLRGLVARHAAENGLPFGLADAIVTIESRYNPHVSNRGAMGLMQIKTQTARSLGFSGTARGLLDPDTNLHYGMRYLATAYRASGGNVCATIMRYTSGARATTMTPSGRAYCVRAQHMMRGA